MNMKTLLGCATAVATLYLSGMAHAAGFDGDTIHAFYIFPHAGTIFEDLGTFAAPGGGEVSSQTYGVSESTITVAAEGGTTWAFAAFNGLEFLDVTRDPHITGISLDPATNAAGVTISDASFTSDSVSLNFQGQIWGDDSSAVFDVSFGSPVPEASTWAMMLVGLGGLGFARLRSRKSASLTA
jgi:PEP-CTERM motif